MAADMPEQLEERKAKRIRLKYFVIGLPVGAILLALAGGGGVKLAPSSVRAYVATAVFCFLDSDPDVCFLTTKPKDSPVTIRGGSIVARAKKGWDQDQAFKHYEVKIDPPLLGGSFKDSIGVDSEDLAQPEFVPETINGVAYAWKVTVTGRASIGHGLMLCSDVLVPLPDSGEPCVKPGTVLTGQRTNLVHLFVIDPDPIQTPNNDVLQDADVDDNFVSGGKHHRKALHLNNDPKMDYIAKNDGIVVEGFGRPKKYKCPDSTCSAWLSTLQ